MTRTSPAVRRSACATGLTLALVAGAVPATPLLAQRADGPYAGALGAQADERQVRGLNLNAVVFGAYDRNDAPDPSGFAPNDPRLTGLGNSGGVAGALSFRRRGNRAVFLLSAGGTARGYARTPDLALLAYQAASSFTTPLTPRVGLVMTASAAYSPLLQFFGTFDAASVTAGIVPTLDFAASSQRNAQADGSIGVTDNITKRTSLFATATGRTWQVFDATNLNLQTWGGRAGVRHRLGRGFGLHAEYGRDQNQYALADGANYVNQTIDAGIDFDDSLRVARSTTLAFSTSTQTTRYLGETHVRVNGSARLSRAFHRTWNSWIGVRRGTEFRVGFRAPLLSDSVDAGLSGQLAWRARWSVGGGYQHGTVGFGTDAFNAYNAVTRLDLALTRTLALYTQYGYYHYDVPPGSSALDVVPRLSRQMAMVGMSLSLPLVNRLRAPRELP